MLSLFGRGVNLDPVVEVEKPHRARTLPDERIKRRQKRSCEDAARPAGGAVKIGEVSPTADLDRFVRVCRVVRGLRHARTRIRAGSVAPKTLVTTKRTQ